MTGTVLERSLASVIARLQKLRILRQQTLVWMVLLVPAILVTLWLPRRSGLAGPEVPVVLATTLFGIVLARIFVRNPSRTEAARLIEQSDPDVNDAVITAVQVSQQTGRRPSVLAALAIEEADKLARQRDWSGAVPGRQIMKWTILSFLSFVLMVSSVMAASRYGRDLLTQKPLPATVAEAELTMPPVTELVIEPGNTEVEQGAALTVVARFPGTVPARAVLEFVDSQKATRQITMTETVDAGVFAARLEEISSDGTYRVLYEETETASAQPLTSPSFTVKTFVRPKLDRVDVVVTPPAWAGKPQERIEDAMRLTVTEGSKVELQLFLNKPVAEAALVSRATAAKIPLVASAQDPAVMEASLVLNESDSWTVELKDAEGRTPAEDEQISIKVTRNEPAKIKPTFPARDTNVSPLQEFLVEAQATDDFGLVDFGVQYSMSGGESREISLKPSSGPASSPSNPAEEVPKIEDTVTATGTTAEPVAKDSLLSASIAHRIELETLNAAPDDFVTYAFWATDISADGQERRIYSDILFAEVRRFEEIFRESQQGDQQQQQQQSQQQQQQESAVDGVLNLQKEIVSATWNSIRMEAASRSDGSFTQNVETIAESQGEAAVQLEAVIEKMEGEPKTTAAGQRAMEQMTSAREMLEEVRDGKENRKLLDAMPLEQSVIQSLLKLRAAEFQIQRQQQGGGGGGGGSSASQQQMDQLELDNKRNRYESEQQARQQQEMSEQQREQIQVLNRLKELARRQQMVNERLKQLESELRAATTEKERDEIERELKRLREEQREMLRDVDELAERMQQSTPPENAQSSEMKQQLQQARENVRQASRAMDDGKLAEAISEGTRAERQFEDMKEEFRQQTSSQFEDAVRDLRDQAQELSEEQQKLARELSGESAEGDAKNQKPSLKSERDREKLQKGFGDQKDRLNRVVEQAKQMIEQAEQSEPLLSDKLYDTVRELKDARPEEALEATEFLAGRGMWSQSMEAEQAARRGIEQLREGIEKAADSVLGSEAESLRRAQDQLADATNKLASEVQDATGEEALREERRPGQQGQGGADEKSSERKDQDSPGRYGKADADESEPSAEKSKAGSSGGDEPTTARRSGQNGQQNDDQSEQSAKESTESSTSDQPGQKSSEMNQKSGEDKSAAQESKGGKGQTAGEDQKAGEGQGGSGQPGEPSSEGQKSSGAGEGAQEESSQSGESQSARDKRGSDERQRQQGQRRQSSLLNGGRESTGGGGSNNSTARPLTGDEFTEWSDQLRDVEEMLEDPELRNRVAQVRDRARAMRAEFKRHGEMPQWDLVKSQLLGEMQSLQQRIHQEISRQESDRAMVPIDREPVPEQFDSIVQRYYELLGQERSPEVTPKATPPK